MPDPGPVRSPAADRARQAAFLVSVGLLCCGAILLIRGLLVGGLMMASGGFALLPLLDIVLAILTITLAVRTRKPGKGGFPLASTVWLFFMALNLVISIWVTRTF